MVLTGRHLPGSVARLPKPRAGKVCIEVVLCDANGMLLLFHYVADHLKTKGMRKSLRLFLTNVVGTQSATPRVQRLVAMCCD